MTARVAAVLERAARYIEEHGWCQGRIKEEDGRVCVIGAIFHVTQSDNLRDRAVDALMNDLGIDVGLGGQWNDAPGRTNRQVIAKLRSVAKKLREHSACAP